MFDINEGVLRLLSEMRKTIVADQHLPVSEVNAMCWEAFCWAFQQAHKGEWEKYTTTVSATEIAVQRAIATTIGGVKRLKPLPTADEVVTDLFRKPVDPQDAPGASFHAKFDQANKGNTWQDQVKAAQALMANMHAEADAAQQGQPSP